MCVCMILPHKCIALTSHTIYAIMRSMLITFDIFECKRVHFTNYLSPSTPSSSAHTNNCAIVRHASEKAIQMTKPKRARTHTHTHSLQFIASCDCSNHSAIGIAIKFTYKFTGAEYFIEIDVLMVLFYILFSVDGDNECS